MLIITYTVYFLFSSKLVPGFTLVCLIPAADTLVRDVSLLLPSDFNFFSGIECSSLVMLEYFFLYSFSLFSFVSIVAAWDSLQVGLVSDECFKPSVSPSSFPTSSSIFSTRSSAPPSEEIVFSSVAGIVISSNGELARVEFGVVEADPIM